MKKNKVSMSVIRRLPRYYRFITQLYDNDIERASSSKLAEIMNVTASQIRQDLNCFGEFGQQGYGYSIKQLKYEIENILGLNNNFNTIIVGMGNLGRAVATHMDFKALGFNLVAMFDRDKELHNTTVNDMPIFSNNYIKEFCSKTSVTAAVLCVPQKAAKPIVETLYNSNVKIFWNFSHYDIVNDYEDTIVENVHLSDSLMTLTYRVNDKLNKT